jgi:F0F1-type ATP synthase membrane subunit a
MSLVIFRFTFQNRGMVIVFFFFFFKKNETKKEKTESQVFTQVIYIFVEP